MEFNDRLLEECGVHLENGEDRTALLTCLREDYERRVGRALTDKLTVDQKARLQELYREDRAGCRRWLVRTVPEGGAILAREAEALRAELRRDRRRVTQVIGGEELQIPLEDLGLSVRTLNCLRRGGLHTVGDVLGKTREEIRSLRHFGPRCMDELQSALAEAVIRD